MASAAARWHGVQVSQAARSAAAALPIGPGVYRFVDARNRTLYIGRAASLRNRVRSYWRDLGDRPRLAAMVRQIDSIQAVSCDSDHEAAWLERNLLQRQLPRWNRTPGGQEVEVFIRLDGSAASAGITVVHSHGSRVAATGSARVSYFGPYLGAARARLAVAGLHRIFPLGYAADTAAGAVKDMARQQGVASADRDALAAAIGAVLDREPAAVAGLQARLTSRRDAAAAVEAFELAGRMQSELDAIDWITRPQRVACCHHADADLAGWADGVLVRFEIRDGRMCGWWQQRCDSAAAAPLLAGTPPQWRGFTCRNAELAARLASCAASGASRPVRPARSN